MDETNAAAGTLLAEVMADVPELENKTISVTGLQRQPEVVILGGAGYSDRISQFLAEKGVKVRHNASTNAAIPEGAATIEPGDAARRERAAWNKAVDQRKYERQLRRLGVKP